MDFSKFRQTGDLSDLVVEVNGTTFKLHKFPLYARSEYFCKLARGHDVGKIELSDFPGGPDTFSLVADFCYNMPVDMSKTNVVQIRCAAEFLKMGGAGNLIETSEKFLKDTITSSKMSRATPCIASLLLNCSTIGHLANECGVVGQCFDALIDCWLKPPTKFSSPTNIMKQSERREDKTVIALLSLPLDWFVNMLVTAREKGVRVSLLAELATSYISIAVDREEADEKQARDKSADAGDTVSSATPLSASLKSGGIKSSKKPADISTVLDNIILELPEESLFDDVVTIDWLTKVIRIATANCCQCRRVLVKSAGEMLTKLSAEDLCIISPSLLHDIVVESCSSENGQAERACKIVDTYMSEMVRKGVLTAETYRLLATVIPKDARSNHDQMYNILEYVLTAEKQKLSPEQRQELIGTINFTLLNEETLQRAQEAALVPPDCIAKGALALCKRLRSELETAKSTILRQEEEVKRLQNYNKRGKRATPIMTSAHAMPSLGLRDSSFSSTGRESELEFMEPTKDYSVDDGHNKSTSDVLNAVRNKLSVGTSNPATSSPYNTFRPLQGPEQDYSFEDEMDYKYDRHFKSLENTRPKNRQTGYSGYRPTYSAYSLRY